MTRCGTCPGCRPLARDSVQDAAAQLAAHWLWGLAPGAPCWTPVPLWRQDRPFCWSWATCWALDADEAPAARVGREPAAWACAPSSKADARHTALVGRSGLRRHPARCALQRLRHSCARHPDVRWLRRVRHIRAAGPTQTELMDALWPLLKPAAWSTPPVPSFRAGGKDGRRPTRFVTLTPPSALPLDVLVASTCRRGPAGGRPRRFLLRPACEAALSCRVPAFRLSGLVPASGCACCRVPGC